MNRRNFLKGFCAVTGTLAVAPSIVLSDTGIAIVPDISRMITAIKPTVFPLDTLLREFIKRRDIRVASLDGTEWTELIETGNITIINTP